jgi:hypothetical protein
MSIHDLLRSMHSISIFDLTLAAVIAFGSILFFLATYFTRPWYYADWIKVALRMIGPLGLLNASLQLYQSLHRHSPLDKVGVAVHNTKFVTNGFVLGLLCLFFLSGECWRGCKLWLEARQKIQGKSKSGENASLSRESL